MPKSIVGIEITPRLIRAAELVKTKKGYKILQAAEIETSPSISGDGEVNDTDLMSSSLNKLWEKGRFKSRNVILGVGNQRILVRNFTVPNISEKDLKTYIPLHIEGVLPVALEESVIDFYPVKKNEKDEIEGLLVGSVKEIISKSAKSFAKSKLKIERIDLIPFALSRSLVYGEDKNKSVIIINLDYGNTGVTAVENGVPTFVRFISSGAENILAGVQKAGGANYEQASRILESVGLGVRIKSEEDKKLAIAINAEVNTIYKSIRTSIKYYEVNSGKHFEKVILSGIGAKIPGLAESIQKSLGVPVVNADPLAGLGESSSSFNNIKSSDLALPIGLVIGE